LTLATGSVGYYVGERVLGLHIACSVLRIEVLTFCLADGVVY
jgi:hypothetical protein